jgi:hypothetical protein
MAVHSGTLILALYQLASIFWPGDCEGMARKEKEQGPLPIERRPRLSAEPTTNDPTK